MLQTKRAVWGILLLTYSLTPAEAEVITYGNTSLGVNPGGHLNWSGSGPAGFATYGVYRAGVGDAISPGCACEGWGVAASLPSGLDASVFFNESTGRGGFGVVNFGFTSNTFTSNVTMAAADYIQVIHQYGPSLAPDIFQAQVTITNSSASVTVDDLIYRRVMDWDVPPTTFSELVTHSGVEANLVGAGGNILFASDNGFASANPLVSAGTISGLAINSDFVDLGPADHGSVFDFSFGSLGPGSSRVFNIFYGSAPNEAAALSRISALGANVYSLGQNSGPGGGSPGTPATFVFAFGGVGGIEPGMTPDVPILPFVPAPGQFVFTEPPPRRWFDPPFASGFSYEAIGGEFLEVMAPPASFYDGEVSLYDAADALLATLAPGASFLFGPGVSKFSIRGFVPPLDAGDPTIYPTFLDFTPGVTRLEMTAIPSGFVVPEPSTYALFAAGLSLFLGFRGKRGRASRLRSGVAGQSFS